MIKRQLSIIGTRGIPAKHGGFETFAEELSLFLVRRGWNVTVYCQVDGNGPITMDAWKGVNRVNIPVSQKLALGTIVFDWKSIRHSMRRSDLILTLGYNTALFCLLYRMKGIRNLINMDGMEWMRQKWTLPARIWLYFNERAGCLIGNHLIADHPEIKEYLSTRVSVNKVTMIPYGANAVVDADVSLLSELGLCTGNYVIVIARPEPENSILEIVKAFSSSRRCLKLVVLGNYNTNSNSYHNEVHKAASDEVDFLGAIYDKRLINTLRAHARLYIHGHTVGGTNPTLVEALGAGMPVLAHENRFNHWVAGDSAHYFKDEIECAKKLEFLLHNHTELAKMKLGSERRYLDRFTWGKILDEYETLLTSWV